MQVNVERIYRFLWHHSLLAVSALLDELVASKEVDLRIMMLS